MEVDSSSGINQTDPAAVNNENEDAIESGGIDNIVRKSVPPPTGKRKKRSQCWDHFTRNPDDYSKCKCNYCGKEFHCDGKNNAASTLNVHVTRCMKNPHNDETRQALLTLHKSFSENKCDMGTLSTWKYDPEAIRKALVEMIIVDELPFEFVEGRGFKKFCMKMNVKFKMPSRFTIARDIWQLYLDEKNRLKQFFKSFTSRICLTIDTWTSIQKINYIVITAHFITDDWKLIKKVLCFCPIYNHKGESIGKAIESTLLEWGIDKIMTVTFDNASSNDTAIDYLKNKLNKRKSTVAKGVYFHMRCIAHIINLVVNAGIKEIDLSIRRVRNAVRYIRSSSARLKQFKEVAEAEKVDCKHGLCLDVSTRWNSTLLMLQAAEKYEEAFESYIDFDPYYESSLKEDLGKPESDDWAKVRRMVDLLQVFYDLALRISGAFYVTSNSFFNKISDVAWILQNWMKSGDDTLKRMGEIMKDKFDKYWGDSCRMNKLICIASIFDPRDKMEFMEAILQKTHGEAKGTELFYSVKVSLDELFEEYGKAVEKPINTLPTNSNVAIDLEGDGGDMSRMPNLRSIVKKQKIARGEFEGQKSELEMYLKESLHRDVKDFDILGWWRINSIRFSILGRMAREVLAIPISTVASEAAFSEGGRVLDTFRSSLNPKTAEALICAKDWYREGDEPMCIEESIDDVDNFNMDMSEISASQGGSSSFPYSVSVD